ncbi:MAG: ribonuclease PH [Bdellovibrionales bacterium]|nr:ribonuclease PH [Bdellovibrionales bacterium]
MRTDGRKYDQLRPIQLTTDIIRYAEGCVQIEMGHTKVICTASVDTSVPKWMSGSGTGWISAEYGMLPRSTHTRIKREKASNSGRTQEISRLIGRSLRAAVDLSALGENQIYIDCDVVQADGGTRTAAITGGFIALALALQFLKDQGEIKSLPLKNYVSAISVGWGLSGALLDLNYDEDSTIDTDMNFVLNQNNHFIEIQGTAEGDPFSGEAMQEMTRLAQKGCLELFKAQETIIGDFFPLER